MSDKTPFGQLDTDEPRRGSLSERWRKDRDAKAAVGCLLFSFAAIAQGVGATAAIAITDPRTIESLSTLITIIAGLSLAAGLISVLIEPIAGYFGSLAGHLCGSVFLFIRLRENALGYRGIEGLEKAEYSVDAAILVPFTLWMGLAVSLAMVVWLRSWVSKRLLDDRDR